MGGAVTLPQDGKNVGKGETSTASERPWIVNANWVARGALLGLMKLSVACGGETESGEVAEFATAAPSYVDAGEAACMEQGRSTALER